MLALSDELRMVNLIRKQRWGTLSTVSKNKPFATMLPFTVEPKFTGFAFFQGISAKHTRNLKQNPYASLTMSEPDDYVTDPMGLARVSVSGFVVEVPTDNKVYPKLSAWLMSRFPNTQAYAPEDFTLLRLVPEDIHFVPQFSRGYRLTPKDLREAFERVSEVL